jgi:cytochrome c-type biogenesis protein CcmF
MWSGIAALVASLALGAYGLAPLLTFTLGGVSGGAALRQVILATRRQGLRGLVGRANGGMIVHLGVILIAVALGASNSYSKSQELSLVAGVPATFAGHSFELTDVIEVRDDRSVSVKARVIVDGNKTYEPAITKYTRIGMNVGTPSVKASLTSDIYLTLEPPVRQDSNTARIKVFIKPMITWLWIGTMLMAVGTFLAAFPGRRRRPTDATSAPVLVAEKI